MSDWQEKVIVALPSPLREMLVAQSPRQTHRFGSDIDAALTRIEVSRQQISEPDDVSALTVDGLSLPARD